MFSIFWPISDFKIIVLTSNFFKIVSSQKILGLVFKLLLIFISILTKKSEPISTFWHSTFWFDLISFDF